MCGNTSERQTRLTQSLTPGSKMSSVLQTHGRVQDSGPYQWLIGPRNRSPALHIRTSYQNLLAWSFSCPRQFPQMIHSFISNAFDLVTGRGIFFFVKKAC